RRPRPHAHRRGDVVHRPSRPEARAPGRPHGRGDGAHLPGNDRLRGPVRPGARGADRRALRRTHPRDGGVAMEGTTETVVIGEVVGSGKLARLPIRCTDWTL